MSVELLFTLSFSQDIARQDVFLIGHPGPTRRRLASLYCVSHGEQLHIIYLMNYLSLKSFINYLLDYLKHSIKQEYA